MKRSVPGTDSQLALFGERSDTSPRGDALRELAARIPPLVRFGTSSWAFPGWQRLVYERKYANERAFVRDSLAEYAAYPLFRTVGIDRAYYQPVPEEDLAHYATQVPADFVAVSKVWADITTAVFPQHPRYGSRAGMRNPRFLDPDLFREAVAGPHARAFASHTGPFVLEMPYAPLEPRAFETALDRFLGHLGAEHRFAVEARDASLHSDRYFGILREHGATHCYCAWSRLPSLRDQARKARGLFGSFVVVRLMLPFGASYEALKEAWAPFDRIVEPHLGVRDDVLALMRAAVDRGYETFVIVSNKIEGCAPATVEALATALVGA